MSLLHTSPLTLGYQKKKTPHPICVTEKLSLPKGSLTALMGANGSGKSTLIKTLCFFIKPLQGEIFINNHPLQTLTSKQRAQQLSIVLTTRPNTGYLNVKETAALGSGQFYSKKKMKICVDNALEATSMQSFANQRANSLSDGEFRRLMIARALVQDSPILILDEPLAYLDPGHKAEIVLLLKKLSSQGKTILFSTHEPGFSLQVANQLFLIMPNARIIQRATPLAISDSLIEQIFQSSHIQFDSKSFHIKTPFFHNSPYY